MPDNDMIFSLMGGLLSILSSNVFFFFFGRAVPVGAVSYRDIDGYRYKRDVLFCYDLKLPKDFVPKNEGNY